MAIHRAPSLAETPAAPHATEADKTSHAAHAPAAAAGPGPPSRLPLSLCHHAVLVLPARCHHAAQGTASSVLTCRRQRAHPPMPMRHPQGVGSDPYHAPSAAPCPRRRHCTARSARPGPDRARAVPLDPLRNRASTPPRPELLPSRRTLRPLHILPGRAAMRPPIAVEPLQRAIVGRAGPRRRRPPPRVVPGKLPPVGSKGVEEVGVWRRRRNLGFRPSRL